MCVCVCVWFNMKLKIQFLHHSNHISSIQWPHVARHCNIRQNRYKTFLLSQTYWTALVEIMEILTQLYTIKCTRLFIGALFVRAQRLEATTVLFWKTVVKSVVEIFMLWYNKQSLKWYSSACTSMEWYWVIETYI